MDVRQLKNFAEKCLLRHGLSAKGWTFRFDGAKRRFGICRFKNKEISVSRHLTALNEEAECFDTVLHEIAHALAGPRAGHGPRWKQACLEVGAKPERCYRTGAVAQPAARFVAVCSGCGISTSFHRRPSRRRACTTCCARHGSGGFDERFLLRVIDTRSGREVGYATTRMAAIAHCPSCKRRYEFSRTVRSPRACGACCRVHANGRFDDRFRLILEKN